MWVVMPKVTSLHIRLDYHIVHDLKCELLSLECFTYNSSPSQTVLYHTYEH